MTAPSPAPTGNLWTRSFTVYWLAGLQSVFGNSLTAVVAAVLVYDLTGRASAMGLTLALGLLPALLSPFAGVVVDRVPLKPLLIVGDLLRGLLVLSLALGLLTGHAGLLWLNSVVLLGGLVTAFASPATSTLLPKLVPEAHLARANGLMSMGMQSAQLAGLLSGAGLVAWLGQSQTLLLDAATFFISAAALLVVRLPPRIQVAAKESFWNSLRAGFNVLMQHPSFALVPVLAFVINIAFAPVQMLLPKHLSSLGLPQHFYGLALAVVVGGMLLGSLTVTALGQRFRPRLALPLGLAGAGVALGLMAVSGWIPAFFAALVLLGAGIALTNTSIVYLGQTLIPEEFRGRVFGLIGATAQAGMPLAMLALGPVADEYGSRNLWLGAALLVLLSVAVWLFRDRVGAREGEAI